MFAFIDESGHPVPNDSCVNSTLTAICIDSERLKEVIIKMYKVRTSIYGEKDVELKAKEFIVPKTLEEKFVNNKHYVERSIKEVLCATADIKLFAIVMDRPQNVCQKSDSNKYILPNYYRLLLQRINNYAFIRNKKCTLVFDTKNQGNDLKISKQVKNYLFKSGEGRLYQSITETPFFVDSKVEECIQLADICAGVIRKDFEIFALKQGMDEFNSWVKSLYAYVSSLTQNFTNVAFQNIAGISSDNILYGIYKIKQEDIYKL